MSRITNLDDIPFSIGIALSATGWHPAAWREPGANPTELFTASYWQSVIAEIEDAGADYVTIDDALQLRSRSSFGGEIPPRPDPGVVGAQLDALLIASWVAPHTSRVGLIPTVTTTHTEPFHVATALQTLDHISGGRAGWQLRISASAAEAASFGRRPAPRVDLDAVLAGHPDPGLDDLLADAADVAEVARRLWDSWEPDAIIRDVGSGRFLDRDRLHHIDFESERFSVVGPSIVPASPQGQLPVTVLAHSPRIFALAARAADVVFITPDNETAGAGASRGKSVAQLVSEVREAERIEARGERGLAPLRIVADLTVALDSDAELATDRLRRLDELAGTPFASDTRVAAGGADEVAELVSEWREQGVDGVRLRPLTIPADLRALSERLLPLLSERIPVRPVEEAATLRERFALPAAINRYAAAREEHAA